MKKEIKILFGIFTVTLLVSGCRQEKNSVLLPYKSNQDSYSLTRKTFNTQEEYSVNISNLNLQTAVFYITPGEINLFSDSSIIAGLLTEKMTEEEKCIVLWKFICNWTYHREPLSSLDQQINDPVILLNGFEYGKCDDRNAALANLAHMAGIKSRVYSLNGHVVAEMFYNNAWHMFDADKHIYYTDETGSIASIGYLSTHSEIIDAKGKTLDGMVEKIRNRKTKAVVVTADDNEITNLYDVDTSSYSSSIYLEKNDRITFAVEPSNFFTKLFSLSVLKWKGPVYKTTGVKVSYINSDSLQKAENGAVTFKQQLPYPIRQITLRTKQKSKVYYSHDNKQWFFKGIAGDNLQVSFNAWNETGAPFVFFYFVKLVFLDSASAQTETLCSVANSFTFSDRIFLYNQRNAFKVIPINNGGSKMRVEFISNN